MIAAQLIAAHNAAMESYRRAMIGEQTFEGRRENLSQANKLSRTYAALIEALNHHRGKGQQKVTVEHVHVHSRGRAVVGAVETPGEGLLRNQRNNPMQNKLPMHLSWRCGARTRSGSRTAVADCTGECRAAPRRVTRTRSSTGATRRRRLSGAGRFQGCCAR
jgi:hypothetical protein